MITQYTNNNIPKRFSNMFNVAVETVLTVTEEYIDLVASILTERNYEYKTIVRRDYIIFGIQFQRITI